MVIHAHLFKNQQWKQPFTTTVLPRLWKGQGIPAEDRRVWKQTSLVGPQKGSLSTSLDENTGPSGISAGSFASSWPAFVKQCSGHSIIVSVPETIEAFLLSNLQKGCCQTFFYSLTGYPILVLVAFPFL